MKKLSDTVKGLLAAAQNSKTKGEVSDLYLELVAKYEDWLAESITAAPDKKLDEQISAVLEDLCTRGSPFWFRSAAVWVREEHQDRGTILVLGPRFNFSGADKNQEGIAFITEICEAGEPLLMRSTKGGDFGNNSVQEFDAGPDTPVAFVQLRKGDRSVGLLTIFGVPGGPLPSRQDGLFLRALGSVIINNVSQRNSRSHSSALAEMDALFACNSLNELWPRAVSIMKRYLSAAGCMIIFRPDPTQPQMAIVSCDGFSEKIYKSMYRVGLGQTGRCAEIGHPCRVDNVSLHQSNFDSELLHALEKAHGHHIHSWMAIPIGDGDLNYGVIKVINRTTRPGWFTDADQQLGLSLALRLRLIIEKFLYINQTEAAREEAHLKSIDARQLAARAENVARQRQQDLMVIMHQLQGPLSSMLGSISYLKSKLRKEELRLPADLHRNLNEPLTNLQDIVSDSLALSYGTFTTFALEAGQKASFGSQNIDAIKELQHLTRRLQKTNARPDLRFHFRQAEDFPSVRMDPNVFISVFYTLIHNAMKYAEPYSKVILECSFERATGEAALKVKSIGEPITPEEKELIFEQFQRGNIIQRSGRHHSGAGLGLWVARTLMRAVGGDLTVELSSTEPHLSVFVVHLPHTQELAQAKRRT